MFSNVYINNIFISFAFFLILANVITLPIIIIQYRKNGFLDIKKSFLIYLFILFLQTVFFLVVLPLPHIDDIRNNPKPITDFINLIPLSFVKDILIDLSKTNFSLKNLITLPAFYQLVFNVFMLIPLGVFLRNFFKLSFKKTLLIGFLVSLFFELTQLSGLYFIYPRPYRMFDVDDLISNTLGTCIGYWISPIFSFIFTNNKKQKQVDKNKVVGLFPQYIIIVFDMFICSIVTTIINLFLLFIAALFLNNNMSSTVYIQNNEAFQESIYLISSLISFILLIIVKPLIKLRFQTIAMEIMKYEFETIDKKWYKIIIRNVVIYLPLLNSSSSNIIMSIYILYFVIMFILKKKTITIDKILKFKIYKYF